MSKSAMVRARVEPGLKRHAETVFRRLGLNATQAITLFYKQVELRDGLPFDLSIPTATTELLSREAPRLMAASSSDSGTDLKTAVMVQTAKTRAPTMWIRTTPQNFPPWLIRYSRVVELTNTGSCGNAWGSRKIMRITGLKGIGVRAKRYARGTVMTSVRTVTTTAIRKPDWSARNMSPWRTLDQ
ncbi:MAG: type II toxin-antitoxin system RelB/DinJ family antitoxin [candidate division NC10 bacterium]|nr:type II toxin-antitoxin system RelB/DinJ family antitoxin [candidate division NC10 bacterium]